VTVYDREVPAMTMKLTYVELDGQLALTQGDVETLALNLHPDTPATVRDRILAVIAAARDARHALAVHAAA
jgi:hypothetical protein